MNKKYTIFETFVGAGGSHLGFLQEGFKTIYVNDFVDNCLKTLVYNNPILKEEAFIDNRSILDIDPSNLKKQLQFKQGEIDVFFGGVVCKGFSLAGERNPIDDRSYLYRKQLDLIKEFKPKISIIENVPGIINAKIYIGNEKRDEIFNLWKELENYKGKKAKLRKNNSITIEIEEEGAKLRKKKKELLEYIEKTDYYISVLDDIKKIYKILGYKVYIKILNSAWYGAATKRERVMIVAVRNDIDLEFEFPEPMFMDNSIYKSDFPTEYLNLPKPITVNEALSKIDYNDKEDIDNIPMKHSDKTIERFKYIIEGENIVSNMENIPEHLKISKFYSRGATMRLNGNEPSPTLVPGHSNFPVHPKEHRSITVREAATITGFPLNYKFFGSHSKRCEHVGNAVPPPLARAIANSCKKLLDKYYNLNKNRKIELMEE